MKKTSYSVETTKVVKSLANGLHEAMKLCEAVEEKKEKQEIEKILHRLQGDIEKFFLHYIDRRGKKREKTLFQDLTAYFAILGDDDRKVKK